MFSAHGVGAEEIAWITWVMLVGTVALTLAMSALGLHAALRKDNGPVGPSSKSLLIGGGILVPLVVIALLLVYGVRTGHSLLPIGEPDLEVRVTGHQWWWQFEYVGPDGQALYSANELHLPVGKRVDIHVTSADVIHSFWIPNLGGKIDALPGRTNTIRLEPTRPGRLRGQCAEFCGAQHTHMAFEVEIHEPEEFQAYLADLGERREPPANATGQREFQRHCADCHSFDTNEQRAGPGLATLARREWLGAGTLRNTPEGLRRWLSDHQTLKSGNHMPDHSVLDPETIEALAQLLESDT